MRITKKAALRLLKNSDFLSLGERADGVRKQLHPEGIVTFVVDRNINYTNVCINKCRFCAFFRDAESPDAYLLTREEIFKKIDETIAQGGTQILLQGGLHPQLDIDYYSDLLKSIKGRYHINVHGFSPPEISFLAFKHHLTIRETLKILKGAGLDSIPGGGAEILVDRVREIVSPRKIKTASWIKVMAEAHLLGMRTTATMMFGSIERPEDIVEHLDHVRALQDRTGGFTAFIPWSFQPGNTELGRQSAVRSQQLASSHNPLSSSLRSHNSPQPPVSLRGGVEDGGVTTIHDSRFFPATAVEYLRILSVSRIYLDNIKNIQASWVTQGLKLAQVALRFGANDFGSTMIEENVVASTGVSYCVSKNDIINAIKSSEFKAAQRDTYYNVIRVF